MYTTCLHCHAELGANDQVEPFPVGRKLAFDPLKQRLWVVCAKCSRWNLSPFDERGEVVDVCERLYHDTVLRKSTGEVGLARLPSGLELVRIGRPIFPEYADWRYGERFKRRKWVARGTGAVGIAAAVTMMWGLPAATAALGFGAIGGNWTFQLWAAWRNRVKARRLVGRYYTSLDRPAERLFGAHLDGLTIEAIIPVAWRLEVPKVSMTWLETKIEKTHKHNFLGFVHGELPNLQPVALGDETRLLSTTIHQINRDGGTERTVRTALELYDEEKGDLFRRVGSIAHAGKHNRMKVAKLPPAVRLALEIQLAEKRDTAWLDGELASLTAAWREAEEIAAIADDLTGPRWIDAELAEARRRRLGEG